MKAQSGSPVEGFGQIVAAFSPGAKISAHQDLRSHRQRMGKIMNSKRAVLVVIATLSTMLGMKEAAAQAAPEAILKYERGLTPNEIADFEARSLAHSRR